MSESSPTLFQDKIKYLQKDETKCEKLKKTIQLIQSLPDDVSRKIYEDYFEATDICKEFLKILFTDKRSQRLEYKHLIDITEKLIKHKCAVVYLRKNCKEFDISYKIHYIENRKSFTGMESLINSFILTILMYLYH